LLLSTEPVRIVRRDTYTDPNNLRPGERPIARADGTYVEYVELAPMAVEPGAEGAKPWRMTVEAGVNGQAPQGAEGTATVRTIVRDEAKLDSRGRPYIATVTKHYLADFASSK
jgi:hypothetical protein